MFASVEFNDDHFTLREGGVLILGSYQHDLGSEL